MKSIRSSERGFFAVCLISAACLSGMAPASARAEITVSLNGGAPTMITASDFRFTYTATLAALSEVHGTGLPHTGQSATPPSQSANFFTLYDFQGWLSGSHSEPVGWTFSAQLVGFTPGDQSPPDNPAIVNLTWTYTAPGEIGESGAGAILGTTFSADSVNSATVSIRTSAATQQAADAGTTPETAETEDSANNSRTTLGPSGVVGAVPEPAALVLLACGSPLLSLYWLRRRKQETAQQ